MSEDSKREETAEAVAEEIVSAEAAEIEPGADTQEAPAKPAKNGVSSIAWLALFFSLLALAALGYRVMEDRRARAAAAEEGESVAELAERIDESRQVVAELGNDLEDLAAGNAGVQSRVESLQREIEEQLRLLESLPARLSSLESSVAALQGVSAGARNTWLLAEAEYYMQIANAQLQLGNNPHLAMLALSMADERVVQMADPALTDVRRAIADELAALEVMEKPDIEGVSLTLASLSRVVESLPLHSAGQGPGGDGEDVDAELSGAARAWASVKNAMAGLVKVTPPDEEARALLTPDTAALIRSNLALQLQAARLALLRGEQAIFEQSLDDADTLLQEYFETGSAPVDSARETIAEIRDSLFAVTPPDISESLRLIRQFRVIAESAQ